MTPQLFDSIGIGYSEYRQPEPRIGALILDALGASKSVVNVGAGAGSYEPRDRFVVAVEPSEVMVRQRPGNVAPVIRASATTLPFRDNSFDAAMAVLTIHHWQDRDLGIREMKRVARKTVLILTWEPPQKPFWLIADHLPHFLESDRVLFLPWFRGRADVLRIETIPIPHDCTDGFLCAYWRRPEAYLDTSVRNAISTFARVGNFESGIARLRSDLADGTWHRRCGHLLNETAMDLGYRLVVMQAN